MNSARALQLPRVRWPWVVPPLAVSLVALAHPIIDPWRAAVAGLEPLVARRTVALLAVAAPLLFLDHPAPFGPVTFAAVAAALAWLARRGPAKDRPCASPRA